MSSSSMSTNEKVKLLEDNLNKADILLDQRFLYFAFNSLGRNAEVQLANGDRGQGQFYTSNLENGGIVLKNFKEMTEKPQTTASKMLFPKDFVYMLVPEVEEPPLLKPKKKDVFKTDTEISKKKEIGKRNLVKWNADDFGGSANHQTLEDSSKEKGSWNQFDLNQEKFGLKSEWDEGKYNTVVDMTKVDKHLLEKAARIEAEILGGTTQNEHRHILEERGLAAQVEGDEEDLYSAVVRVDEVKPKEEPKVPKFTNLKKTVSNSSNDPKAQSDTSKPPGLSVSQTGNASLTSSKSLEIPQNKSSKVLEDQKKFSELKKLEEQDNPNNVNILKLKEANSKPQASNQSLESPPKTKIANRAQSFTETSGTNLTIGGKPTLSTMNTQEYEEKKNEKTFDPILSSKFKIKLGDNKKADTPFFQTTMGGWEKKSSYINSEDFNSNWKIQKKAMENQRKPINSNSASFNPKPQTNTPSTTSGGTTPTSNTSNTTKTFNSNSTSFNPQQSFNPGFNKSLSGGSGGYQGGFYPNTFTQGFQVNFFDPNQASFNYPPQQNMNSGGNKFKGGKLNKNNQSFQPNSYQGNSGGNQWGGSGNSGSGSGSGSGNTTQENSGQNQ